MTIRRCTYLTPSDVHRAWDQLTKRPQEVRVVLRGDRPEIHVGHSINSKGLAGYFDMGIALDDFTEELEHAARDLYKAH